MLADQRISQVIGMVRNDGRHAQTEYEEQARKHDAKEQRHEVADVSEEDAQPETRWESEPFGKTDGAMTKTNKFMVKINF